MTLLPPLGCHWLHNSTRQTFIFTVFCYSENDPVKYQYVLLDTSYSSNIYATKPVILGGI